MAAGQALAQAGVRVAPEATQRSAQSPPPVVVVGLVPGRRPVALVGRRPVAMTIYLVVLAVVVLVPVQSPRCQGQADVLADLAGRHLQHLAAMPG